MAEDTRWQEREPTTDAELCDFMRWAFGFGYYDEFVEGEPYYKTRLVEISRIKAARSKMKLSIPDVVMVARYCKRQGIALRWLNQLNRYVVDAREDEREFRRMTVGLEAELRRAIECEHSLADAKSEHWVTRLTRAQGQYREEVLAEWTQSRSPSLTQK